MKESDEEFTIRFKRSENRKRLYIPKIPTMALIDDSTDDDVANSNDVKDHFDILLDDEADDEVPHSYESDDRPNEYDFSDTFNEDGPLDDELSQADFDSDN
ncbi:hypothetical protein Tco_1060742 [Tanacetum coccineum]